MTRYADKDAEPPKVHRCPNCGRKWPFHDHDCHLRHTAAHCQGGEMTRTERIDIALDIFERRAASLGRAIREGLLPHLVDRAMTLCAMGAAGLRDALDSTDDAPPVVVTGQGDCERVYP